MLYRTTPGGRDFAPGIVTVFPAVGGAGAAPRGKAVAVPAEGGAAGVVRDARDAPKGIAAESLGKAHQLALIAVDRGAGLAGSAADPGSEGQVIGIVIGRDAAEAAVGIGSITQIQTNARAGTTAESPGQQQPRLPARGASIGTPQGGVTFTI